MSRIVFQELYFPTFQAHKVFARVHVHVYAYALAHARGARALVYPAGVETFISTCQTVRNESPRNAFRSIRGDVPFCIHPSKALRVRNVHSWLQRRNQIPITTDRSVSVASLKEVKQDVVLDSCFAVSSYLRDIFSHLDRGALFFSCGL